MTYQAIQTKFLGPTNVRGSRVKAFAEAGSITLNWDHRLNSEENHKAAAVELTMKLGWDRKEHYGKIVMGGLPGGGYAFVFTDNC